MFKTVTRKYEFPITCDVFKGYRGFWDEDEYATQTDLKSEYFPAVRDALMRYVGNDNMAEYYDGIGNKKLISAVWGVEERGEIGIGTVTAILAEDFTAEENEAFKEWIAGKNSDGLGEGFEQYEIRYDGYTLSVHFWYEGDDYSVTEAQK